MADPSSEDEGLLREWAPLTSLLQQIPLKAQRGIFTHELNLTCVDALSDFIALGTNLGLVYWYNRRKGELQRLRCENTASAVTCVKVISTVDYMVAAGNEQGIVSVFQVPKDPPDCLPESMKPRRKKQVERFTISGLHSSPVTAIEWSLNGMKLFSGDKNGLVVLTEIDFYMHLSKSVELLNEKYEIVQLSYCQQLLLVSTTYRSIVCHRDDRWRVAQVGQKERKSLGKLGATFCVGSERPQDLIVYASRPGLRLWLADKNGIVQQTLIYKDTMMREHRHVPLVNPVPAHMKTSRIDHTFGPLHVFKENLLVTYNQDTVYVLNPIDIFVVATVSDLRRVQDVSVTKDEIFILEGDRSIIRVAYLPENVLEQQGIELPCDRLAMNEVFLQVVGNPKFQEKLHDSSADKSSVWLHVASAMTQLGYPFDDDNGAKMCEQKWNYMVKSYNTFQKTKKWNNESGCPAYFETLEHILNPILNFYEETTVAVTSVEASEGPAVSEPQLKKIKQDHDLLYDADSILSTVTQYSEESEVLEAPEVSNDPNSICVDLLNEGGEIYYDDEHITVYPVTSNSELPEEVLISNLGDVNVENNQNVYILVTPSFDKTSEFVKDSEDEDGKVDASEVISFSFDPHEEDQTIDFDNKECNSSYTDTKELVITPKSNQTLRPVPTPAQALMALVSRIGREEKQRDNLRKYNMEKRFVALENAIWKQNIEIMELTEKATALLNLLKEDTSDSE